MRRPVLLMAAVALGRCGWAATVRPVDLRCEYEPAPLAVESPQPRLSWELQAVDPARRDLRQTAYRILVASSEALLVRERGDLWDTGRVSSSETIQIPYGGKTPPASKDCFWKVQVWDEDGNASAWSDPASWRMAPRPQDWQAKWIAAQADGTSPEQRMPIFRRAFALPRAPKRAIAYISGLGQYDLSVNGEKVGEAVLTPGWTNYRKTVFYNAYDVTKLLRAGRNALGVMLGNGMYNVARTPGRYTKFTGSFGQPKLIAQIHVEFADGTSTEIVTDSSWKTHSGPIVFSSTYGGEDYDARLELAGWNTAPFDDQDWTAALEAGGPGGRLVAQENPDIQVMRRYAAEKITHPRPDIQVYDLGQNFSGWPEIKVRGDAGATVKLIPGELVDADGLVTQRSSGGPQWFSYTLKGGGDETWHPLFSYYGFRYVQVEGATRGTEVRDLRGAFIYSSAPKSGEFSCSKPLFNQIHALIDRAIESNMQSVLTDCPHREKLGWLEQSHLAGLSLMYNFDLARLYEKIADDMRDAQTAEGLVPDIAPEYTVFEGGFRDSPEWGSAVVLDPWLAYRHYGDREILAAHYAEMQRYLNYLSEKANGGIVAYGLGDWYDIGPKAPGYAQLTSLDLTATAIYYADIVTLRKAAMVLGKQADAGRLEDLASAVRTAFNTRLYHGETGTYDRGSQTAYAMPLALGIAPEEHRAQLLDGLVADIRQHSNRTTAGDVGYHFAIQALAEGGRSDVIFDMLSNDQGPGYAYQLKRGATALTEAWDTNPESSQNHFMLGHVEEWFFRWLAGIDFDLSRAPDERIILRPNPVGDVTAARASYRSALGVIVSDWRLAAGTFSYDVEIPPNTSATVYVPSRNGAAPHRIGSGRYHFEVTE
jgi:alpha-L-rhamnosidase